MQFNPKHFFKQKSSTMEEQIFKSVSFLAAICTLYYVFHSYYWGLGVGLRINNLVSFLIFSLFFILAHFRGLFVYLVYPFIFFVLTTMTFVWIYSGGSKGVIPFLYSLGFIAFIMITDSKQHGIVFLLTLANLLLMMFIEYWHPEWIVVYPNMEVRQIDLYIGNLVSVIFVGLLIATLKNNYNKEKIKVSQQKLELEKAYETKSRFLANMSHEIRTPMNGMLGMASVLSHTELNNQQREYLNIIEVSGERLLNIINEILDYSKLEAGEMKLANYPFSIQQCLSEVLDITAVRAFSKNLELLYQIDKNIPKIVVGDFTKLRQILLNIIGNALKFTKQGEIFIKVELIHHTTDQAQILFAIKDTGIGISKENMTNLFKSFTQVDGSNSREYGGTGLGLSISKEFVDMMKGQIWAESEVDKGSTFYFSAFFNLPTPQELPVVESEVKHLELLQGKKVLLVDDNKMAQKLLAEKLQEWGMKVDAVSSAKAALHWLNEAKGQADIALIDSKMPITNGLELGRAFRNVGANFHLALMLSHDNLNAVEISEVMDTVLQKPIKEEFLLETLVEIFRNKTAENKQNNTNYQVLPNEEKKQPILKALNILVVEDDLVNQKLVMTFLQMLGYQPHLAQDGQEALEMLQERAYDLILMDIQLPKLDGLECTKIVRKRLDIQQPIIVAMTANVLQEEEQKCMEVGMNYFLQKPISISKLEQVFLMC